MPTACRFRMYQGNGSTCPHALTRSSLISAKVRTRFFQRYSALTFRYPPCFFSCMRFGLLTYPHRAREGHSRPRTGDIASRASPCCRHLAAVFNSVLPEPCAGRAAQRACATKCVTVLLSRPSFRCTQKKSLLIRFMLVVGQSLLRCSSSKGVVARSSARQSVSRMITGSAPSCVGADARYCRSVAD
jgi:hypothetical protein